MNNAPITGETFEKLVQKAKESVHYEQLADFVERVDPETLIAHLNNASHLLREDIRVSTVSRIGLVHIRAEGTGTILGWAVEGERSNDRCAHLFRVIDWCHENGFYKLVHCEGSEFLALSYLNYGTLKIFGRTRSVPRVARVLYHGTTAYDACKNMAAALGKRSAVSVVLMARQILKVLNNLRAAQAGFDEELVRLTAAVVGDKTDTLLALKVHSAFDPIRSAALAALIMVKSPEEVMKDVVKLDRTYVRQILNRSDVTFCVPLVVRSRDSYCDKLMNPLKTEKLSKTGNAHVLHVQKRAPGSWFDTVSRSDPMVYVATADTIHRITTRGRGKRAEKISNPICKSAKPIRDILDNLMMPIIQPVASEGAAEEKADEEMECVEIEFDF